MRIGPQACDAQVTAIGIQPPGLGKLGGGTFGLPLERERSSQISVYACRISCRNVVCLLERADRLSNMRLQQLHKPDPNIQSADERITGTEAEGLFLKRKGLID